MSDQVTTFTATYSAEDDKIRIYFDAFLDHDLYSRFTSMGFRKAPIQGCHFAVWSPEREDFAFELAGDILPEEMTMAERAELKAARCEKYAEKNLQKANSFNAAAHAIAARFEAGQPILIGHHSERKANRAKRQMETAKRASLHHADMVGYWNYKATGAERHANRKNDPRVRVGRIKTLLADMRSLQRILNDSYKAILLWESKAGKFIESETFYERVTMLSGLLGMSPYLNGKSCYCLLKDRAISALEVYEHSIDAHHDIINNENIHRKISHLLNRLGYERSMLGDIQRFEGDLTPVILQGFLREQGAQSPTVTETERGYSAVSDIPFPLHVNSGVVTSFEMTAEEWRDLMLASGHEVVIKEKTAKQTAPILNFKSPAVKTLMHRGKTLRLREMTKAEYSNTHAEHKGVVLSSCGTFKVRVVYVPDACRHFFGEWFFVYQTDSKTHPVPNSDALNVELAA